jgi:Ca2+-binding RTX toxin-like protein
VILNGGDDDKDSSLSLLDTRFAIAGQTAVFGAPIALALFAELVDSDGSENLTFSISGIPAGASFTAGTDNGNGSWSFTAAELNDLHLLPADDFTGTLALTATATATESANGDSASTSQTFNISIGETTNTLANGSQNADTLTGTNDNDLIRGYAGNDIISGGDGNDLIYGGAGNDTLNGGAGHDRLFGGVGDDILNGDAGNDYLDGGSGNDLLNGGEGDDILLGGSGNDTLTGGAGADTFVWRAGDTGNDVIQDFNIGEGDRIDLSDLLQGETDGTIDNYLQLVTDADGTSSLLISTEGHLNDGGGTPASNADTTIELTGVNLSSSSISSLIAGSDPTIKIDHT